MDDGGRMVGDKSEDKKDVGAKLGIVGGAKARRAIGRARGRVGGLSIAWSKAVGKRGMVV